MKRLSINVKHCEAWVNKCEEYLNGLLRAEKGEHTALAIRPMLCVVCLAAGVNRIANKLAGRALKIPGRKAKANRPRGRLQTPTLSCGVRQDAWRLDRLPAGYFNARLTYSVVG